MDMVAIGTVVLTGRRGEPPLASRENSGALTLMRKSQQKGQNPPGSKPEE
jgi:hypothetical protein